jgi:hypothetical protein
MELVSALRAAMSVKKFLDTDFPIALQAIELNAAAEALNKTTSASDKRSQLKSGHIL